MWSFMMEHRGLPLTTHDIQVGLLVAMFVGLVLMILYPKGRPNDVITFITALLSVGSLAVYAISSQLFL